MFDTCYFIQWFSNKSKTLCVLFFYSYNNNQQQVTSLNYIKILMVGGYRSV